MTFNSTEFAIFFLIVFTAYWLLKKKVFLQNILILAASYIFYGWWNWRFLIILAGISLISFTGAIWLEKLTPARSRKILLWSCLTLIASTLILLKYYNFFVDSINSTTVIFGLEFRLEIVKLFLPIGLSYYVFQTIGYCVDVYRQKVSAEKNLITYFSYVSFFPHLLSGPIGQSTKLLPQFSQTRTISFADMQESVQKIVWGLFKKVVVADALGRNVNYIFAHYQDLSGSLLVLGVIMFSFQIYADFSGYSTMAEGFAKLLGFDLTQNFRFPYFSRSIAEFWRRWHRSLSAWLKDYIYLPLGGRGENKFVYARNILITFTFSGFWHGASWNFIIWGFLNGLYFLPSIFRKKKDSATVTENKLLPTFLALLQMIFIFSLISFSRIFFRAPDLATAVGYLKGIFSASLFSIPNYDFTCFLWVGVLLIFEWFQHTETANLRFAKWHFVPRFASYIGFIAAIAVSFGQQNSRDYLYFKF